MCKTSTVKVWNCNFIIHFIFLDFHVVLEEKTSLVVLIMGDFGVKKSDNIFPETRFGFSSDLQIHRFGSVKIN